MTLTCIRCENTGFLNLHQVDAETLLCFDHDGGVEVIEHWLKVQKRQNIDHDVQVCDCCGDGEGWYGIPGEHYTSDDPRGDSGPYSYNGGLCECN